MTWLLDFKAKKKPRKRSLSISFSNLIEEQNALAPLRLTVKVKAKPKIVRIQVHLDFDYAANLKAKKIRRKGSGKMEIGKLRNWEIGRQLNLTINIDNQILMLFALN